MFSVEISSLVFVLIVQNPFTCKKRVIYQLESRQQRHIKLASSNQATVFFAVCTSKSSFNWCSVFALNALCMWRRKLICAQCAHSHHFSVYSILQEFRNVSTDSSQRPLVEFVCCDLYEIEEHTFHFLHSTKIIFGEKVH